MSSAISFTNFSCLKSSTVLTPSTDFASSITFEHELLATNKSISLPNFLAASTTLKVAADKCSPLCSAITKVFILLLPRSLIYLPTDQQFQLLHLLAFQVVIRPL